MELSKPDEDALWENVVEEVNNARSKLQRKEKRSQGCFKESMILIQHWLVVNNVTAFGI